MRLNKIFAMVGSVLILSAGSMVFAQQGQAAGSQDLNRSRVENRLQVRPLFVDENGDGICDIMRDHDNDGIPNGQDPDWIKPKDGSGFKNGQGNQNAQNQLGHRNAFKGENGQAFKGENGQRFKGENGQNFGDENGQNFKGDNGQTFRGDNGQNFGNQTFRNNNSNLGKGTCDVPSSKGNGNKGGNK